LQRIGERYAAAHIRTQANTLWILNQPCRLFEQRTARVNLVEAKNAVHTSSPKAS